MTVWRGLTWDHPRGRRAHEAAAGRVEAETGERIDWAAQPLEGFESSPIDDIAERYDLVVLDHPHLGDALAAGSLRALEEFVPAARLRELDDAVVGPSLASYRMDGRLWALPLDAATQVAVRRPEAVPEAPSTWPEVLDLARRAPVALSLAGPHAYLSWCSVVVALGGDPVGDRPEDRAAGAEALELMAELAARAPLGTEELNPIAMLEDMVASPRIAYVPLVYGYVGYADRLRYADAPVARPGGRHGSTLGGTGVAVSRRCTPSAALVEHLLWLLSAPAQTRFIPRHAGQPSLRIAWRDGVVDREANGFYAATAATIEDAWVRPRGRGATARQLRRSARIREALAGRRRSTGLIDELMDSEVRA